MIGGFLPYCSANRAPKLMSLLNILTGGVFLAAGLIDLLPDSVECLDEYMEKSGLPVAYLCCALAFIMVFIVEELAENMAQKMGQKLPRTSYDALPQLREDRSFKEDIVELINGGKEKDKKKHKHEHHEHKTCKHTTGFHPDDGSEIVRPSMRSQCETEQEEQYISGSQGLIVLLALSFHSVMEGLGLGASNSTSFFGIFLAIMGHKMLAAFALGTILHNCYSANTYITMMVSFSLATPIGALCGMLLTNGADSSVATGVCTALAAGTFLHVAAMEVIPQELHNNKHGQSRVSKLIAMVIGFVLFTCLVLITG